MQVEPIISAEKFFTGLYIIKQRILEANQAHLRRQEKQKSEDIYADLIWHKVVANSVSFEWLIWSAGVTKSHENIIKEYF